MSAPEVSPSSENGENSRDLEMEHVEKHLRRMSRELGLASPTFAIAKGAQEGDNFLSTIYRVATSAEESGQPFELRSIVKCPPLDEQQRKAHNINTFFLREIFFYEEVVPVFADLLKEHGLRARYFPKLHAASKETRDEILILEDLAEDGYAMRDSKLLDHAHVSYVLKCLGELHAYSFALRARKPEEFDRLRSVKETLFRHAEKDSIPSSRMQVLCDVVRKALVGEEKHYTERFDRFVSDYQRHMVDAVDGSAAEPYAVLNHGDCWTNNILFKYKKGFEGPPVIEDLKFIDFQLSRYASPVTDIVYVLFCCCTHETRNKNYERLLRDYHDSLCECLLRLECDATALFPFEKLLQQLQRFGKYGGGMAVLVIHMITDDKKRITSFSEPYSMETFEERLREDEVYRRMLRDTFVDLTDKGYI